MLKVLPRWKLFAGVWLATVSALGTGLLAVRLGYSPLDDPDQAHQRPGYVDANPPRSLAPALPGLGPAGTRSVMFFTRPDRLPRLLAALGAKQGQDLLQAAHVVVVQPGAPGPAPPRVVLLGDPTGLIRRGLVTRIPRDGGYPVGYAVIGPDRTVRYRTEDPQQDRRLSEVLTAVSET